MQEKSNLFERPIGVEGQDAAVVFEQHHAFGGHSAGGLAVFGPFKGGPGSFGW